MNIKQIMRFFNVILICILICLGKRTFAQHQHFVSDGTIEFEKTINTYAVIGRTVAKSGSDIMKQSFEQFKKSQPQFIVQKSTLHFSKERTLFSPIAAEGVNLSLDYFAKNPMLNQINIVFNDFRKDSSVISKKVFEESFLIKDNIRRIKWKITNETRDIAGYKCRRANGLVLDSIYLVAFYSEKIKVPGGPEAFSGLPGMILGVAVPHENVTWFAIKVTEQSIALKALTPPVKGKVVDTNGFLAIIRQGLSNSGLSAQLHLSGFLL